MNQSLDEMIQMSKPIKKEWKTKGRKMVADSDQKMRFNRREVQEIGNRQPIKQKEKGSILSRIKTKEQITRRVIQQEEEEEEEEESSYDQMLQMEKRLEGQSQIIQEQRRMINKEYKTVIMSNMASDIQLAEIYQVFNKFGTIHTILVNWPVLSSENSKILGEVTIQYDTMLEAHKAQKETNGAVFNGNVLQASLLKQY